MGAAGVPPDGGGIRLGGGRTTASAVRVGDTVRRTPGSSAPFVHALLEHLADAGFDRAPRFLGVDDRGREILTYVYGWSPPNISAYHSDLVLTAAARVIGLYHGAVAGSSLAGPEEVVCHNDLSPCNFAFRGGLPWGIFDFDAAAPGPRGRDLAYALFLWLNVGTDGPLPAEQARRVHVMLGAYGIGLGGDALVERWLQLTAAKHDWRRAHGLEEPGGWWAAQHGWLVAHRDELLRTL